MQVMAGFSETLKADKVVGQGCDDIAEVALHRGDQALAMEHLDAAGELFARHGGAKLYLDEVLAKKQFPQSMTSGRLLRTHRSPTGRGRRGRREGGLCATRSRAPSLSTQGLRGARV